MPRPKKQNRQSSLSPGQAVYVLERLIRERRVSKSDVSRYVSEMGREIAELESRLKALREAQGGTRSAGDEPAAAPVRGRRRTRKGAASGNAEPQPAASKRGAARSGKRAGAKRTPAVSAERAASRKLQGKYLSLVRRFAKNKRAQFARIAKEQGRETAIRQMAALLKK